MISIHPKHSFDLNSFRVATKVIRFTEISDLLSTVNIFKTCETFFLWYIEMSCVSIPQSYLQSLSDWMNIRFSKLFVR